MNSRWTFCFWTPLQTVSVLMLTVFLCSCSHFEAGREERVLDRYEFSQPQMGVPFQIVLYADDSVVAEQAAAAAFARIAELNGIMSDYESDSELNRLARTAGSGSWVAVSEDLWRVLERSQRLAQESFGAFDITVGPYVALWRRARRARELPEAEDLARFRPLVGHQRISLNPLNRSVRLEASGMKLDLGGIAKGYAVDEAMKVLRSRGITRALVAGVGDILVAEAPPGRSGWRIAISEHDAPGAPKPPSMLLRNAAISTSGDASQKLEIDGRRYSHIVDPRTGIGLTDHSLVTVIARDCTTSDSVATAVSVLGPGPGLRLVRGLAEAEVRIVRDAGDGITVHESRGFKRYQERPAANVRQ